MTMTRSKNILIAFVAVVLLLGGSVAILPRLLWGDGVDYSKVVSIRESAQYQDPALLAQAWALPVAKVYQKGLDFQGNGSFCGPTSVVNVMRSLGLEADQKTVLADTGISAIFGILPGGLTLEQLSDVVKKRLGKPAAILRDLSLEQFREEMQHANDPSVRYIINFHRGPIFGKGGGHFSPVAGYLAAQDLVFVLDVNDSYRPWLAKTERLYAAMNTIDRSSGKKRGLLRVR